MTQLKVFVLSMALLAVAIVVTRSDGPTPDRTIPPPPTTTVHPFTTPATTTTTRPPHDPCDGPKLQAVQMVDAQVGWAVGACLILGTTDGGEHWTPQYSGKRVLAEIDAVDETHAWATGVDGIVATTDGGTWTMLPWSGAYQSVHFIDPSHGWAVGFGARNTLVEHTDDGGVTWSGFDAPDGPVSVCFSEASRGWLGTDQGEIFTWEEGGWQPVLTGQSADELSVKVSCAGDAVWAVEDAAHVDRLVRASPGGQVEEMDLGPELGPVSPIDASHAVVIGRDEHGSPAVTFVGGEGEHTQPPVFAAAGAAFLTMSSGWIVGTTESGASTIVHTDDGGATWTVQATYA